MVLSVSPVTQGFAYERCLNGYADFPPFTGGRRAHDARAEGGTFSRSEANACAGEEWPMAGGSQ
jgi:hypothetical protein